VVVKNRSTHQDCHPEPAGAAAAQQSIGGGRREGSQDAQLGANAPAPCRV